MKTYKPCFVKWKCVREAVMSYTRQTAWSCVNEDCKSHCLLSVWVSPSISLFIFCFVSCSSIYVGGLMSEDHDATPFIFGISPNKSVLYVFDSFSFTHIIWAVQLGERIYLCWFLWKPPPGFGPDREIWALCLFEMTKDWFLWCDI